MDKMPNTFINSFFTGLVALDGIAERHVHHFIILDADHHVTLPFAQSRYGAYPRREAKIRS